MAVALQSRTHGVNRTGTTHNLVGQRLGRKGQETRDRILAAMSHLLEIDDEAPITLSAVSREASIGMSTLYLYFPDLGELVLAVLSRTIKENEPGFIEYLGEFWSDAALSERVLSFTRAHFAFWEKHARLMQMRNSFADARDMRFVRYRQKMSGPVRAMLVRQMCAQPGACEHIYEDCATVMLSGLERVATIVINPDFATLAGVENPEERTRYVERLALAEARLIETLIRDMRSQARQVVA
jgi:AcrR family transcriptional regulator